MHLVKRENQPKKKEKQTENQKGVIDKSKKRIKRKVRLTTLDNWSTFVILIRTFVKHFPL